ncbi:hypothetical protein NEF87_002239 [Candidatus Lokiarchaeum ossiferum]|uniref:MarR family transcriptional regulator n=1 Tax=Candidatus Lokiarchaeum ossiferum TaxID=2951803 RepID=A0ABY6HR23_9ARCH|nr:hypothetical protein NEF87_002239 [Candidatus Lokiarchaeum sp. B-35]
MELHEHLYEGKFKEIEQEIVQFYKNYANNLGRNLKLSVIYAYLVIYDSLTQKQLKKLTKYSYSTISTGLAHLVQMRVIKKNLIAGTHTHLYKLPSCEFIPFNYQPFSNILERLNNLFKYIKQTIQKCHSLMDIYPVKSQFFIYRLNGILNYIQAQQRNFAIKGKTIFLPENDRLLPISQEITDFPPEIEAIEFDIVSYLVENKFLFDSKPILSKIMAYIMLRKNITQKKLQDLTGNSSGAVSQKLKQLLDKNLISRLPFESPTTPRIFQIKYISLNYMDFIIRDNRIIFDFTPRLEAIQKSLIEEKEKYSSLHGYNSICSKVDHLIISTQRFTSVVDSFSQERNIVADLIEDTA